MSTTRIDILAHRKIYDKWATLSEYTLQYSSNKMDEEMVRVVFDSGDGAATLLYNDASEKLLFVEQFRFGAYFNTPADAMMLEVCAGIVDENDPKSTAIREIYEETGYEVSKVEHVATVYPTPGAHTEKLHLFIGKYDQSMKRNSGGGLDSEHEDIILREISYASAVDMLRRKEIKDAKTMLLIQHWMLTCRRKLL